MIWYGGVYSKGIVVLKATMSVWEASFGDALMYEREPDNASDGYAVAVIRKSIPDMEIVLLKIQSSTSTWLELPHILFELASKFHTINISFLHS